VIHSLTANIGHFGSTVTALFISFFDGRMFSRWIVTTITSARGTLLYRITRIPCGCRLTGFQRYLYNGRTAMREVHRLDTALAKSNEPCCGYSDSFVV
jgi:hypothetical protein